MKLLKYRVDFENWYGADVHDYCLMPVEFMGSYSPKEELGVTIEEVIDLGEIAGKHSECYGDLTITVIDLDELNQKAINELIEGSNKCNFDCYFDTITDRLEEILDEGEDNELTVESVELNRKKLIDKYNVTDKGWGINGDIVCEAFIKYLKQKYVTELSVITIKQEDRSKAVELLQQNGIEYYL